MTHLAAVAGIVSISFSAIFMRLASAITGNRRLLAGGIRPPVAAGRVVGRSARRDHRDRRSRLLAFAAGLILALDLFVWQMAIDRIGAGLAVVLAAVQVVIVGALAWVFYRERPTVTALAVVPVVLLGVAMISGVGRSDSYGSDPILGTVFGLATAFTYAGFLLVFRPQQPGPPGARRRDRCWMQLSGPRIGSLVGADVRLRIQPGILLAAARMVPRTRPDRPGVRVGDDHRSLSPDCPPWRPRSSWCSSRCWRSSGRG